MANFFNKIKMQFMDKNKVLTIDDSNNVTASNVLLADVAKTSNLIVTGDGSKYLSDDGTYKSPDIDFSTPVGSICIWPMPIIPFNYLPCDGRAISRTDYKKLFSILGTFYGQGDGSTTFNLPDATGRTYVHLNASIAAFSSIGKKSGDINTQQHSHIQNSHTHTFTPVAHTHTLNSHTHTVPAHAHGLNAHTHSFTGAQHRHEGLRWGFSDAEPISLNGGGSTGYNLSFSGGNSGLYNSITTSNATATGTIGGATGNTANSSQLTSSANDNSTSSTTQGGSLSSVVATNNAYGIGNSENIQPSIVGVYIIKVI